MSLNVLILRLSYIFCDHPQLAFQAVNYFVDDGHFINEGTAFLQKTRLKPNTKNYLIERMGRFDLSKTLNTLEKLNIQTIDLFDSRYPEELRHLSDPPILLYTKGNLNYLNGTKFGVVGTRKISDYGRQVTRQFTQELSDNFIIVSGMAAGVDTIAHETVLRQGRPTIAVVGTGLDIVYPKQNEALFKQLCIDGLVISEYCPGTQAFHYRFPQRNRIVAALSVGVLICEAGERSGSLITARLSAEMGKEVFVVPGSIFNTELTGNHRLIQDGAKLVMSNVDIMEEFGQMSLLETHPDTSTKPDLTVNFEFDSNQEKMVFDTISDGEKSLDEIQQMTMLPIHVIFQILTVFEMKKYIKQLPGKRFKRYV